MNVTPTPTKAAHQQVVASLAKLTKELDATPDGRRIPKTKIDRKNNLIKELKRNGYTVTFN